MVDCHRVNNEIRTTLRDHQALHKATRGKQFPCTHLLWFMQLKIHVPFFPDKCVRKVHPKVFFFELSGNSWTQSIDINKFLNFSKRKSLVFGQNKYAIVLPSSRSVPPPTQHYQLGNNKNGFFIQNKTKLARAHTCPDSFGRMGSNRNPSWVDGCLGARHRSRRRHHHHWLKLKFKILINGTKPRRWLFA